MTGICCARGHDSTGVPSGVKGCLNFDASDFFDFADLGALAAGWDCQNQDLRDYGIFRIGGDATHPGALSPKAERRPARGYGVGFPHSGERRIGALGAGV